MTRLSTEAVEALTAAQDYRAFLNSYMGHCTVNGKALKLADIARRAQLSSRSFVSDIMKGKRRITPSTLPKFKQAFRLTGLWAQYFDLLVMKDEDDCRPIKIKRDDLPGLLSGVRKKLLDKHQSQKPISKDGLGRLFQSVFVFDIFAALGGYEKGADFGQIVRRTRLAPEIILTVIESLVALGFIEQKRNRYFAKIGNFDLEKLGSEHSFIKAYQQALDVLRTRAEAMTDDPAVWYFHTAFSVDRSRLPALNQRLKEVIFEFLDEAQVDDGDAVVRLTLGFGI